MLFVVGLVMGGGFPLWKIGGCCGCGNCGGCTVGILSGIGICCRDWDWCC